MRVINANDVPVPTASRTSARLSLLRPTTDGLIDAGFLAVLLMVGLLGFRTTFDSLRFLAISAIGIVLMLVVAHIVTTLRWHWLIAIAAAIAAYFLFGGALAVREDLIAGFVPSLATIANLWSMVIDGWKAMLTTTPPVQGSGDYLALPFLLALLSSAVGYTIARSTKSPRLALIVPVIVFILVILLGTVDSVDKLIRGLGFAAVGLVWAALRTTRRRTMGDSTGSGRTSRLVLAVLLIVASAAGAAFLGPLLPGADSPRTVLRPYVVPPVDTSQYASPLPGLRKYSSSSLNQYYDQTLMTVDGITGRTFIRISVLDAYDGLVWSANGTVGDTGFKRMGSQMAGSTTSEPVKVTITIGQTFADQPELNVWVPNIGPISSISFSGPHAADLTTTLAYDQSKGQALATSRLGADDQVTMMAYPTPLHSDRSPLTPTGPIIVSDQTSLFMADSLKNLLGQDADPWKQLLAVADSFRAGRWSDGTRGGEERYRPGDGEARLAFFMAGEEANKFVGSDEHYAAAFALAANRLGFPARVVFGAMVDPTSADTGDGESADASPTPDVTQPPSSDGTYSSVEVKGSDVKAWVEIDTPDGWVALDPTLYIPDRSRVPNQSESVNHPNSPPEIVPPANPVDPPGNLNNQTNTDATVTPPERTCEELGNCPEPWWTPLLGVATYVGAGFGALIALLAVIVVWKSLRSLVRKTSGSYTRRVAKGWVDVLDRVRDTGQSIPAFTTRSEQAIALGSRPLIALAASVDQAMFQQRPPDATVVDGLWKQVKSAKAAVSKQYGWFRRLWIHINPHSLKAMSKKALGLAKIVTPRPKGA